jgi:uncharacterized phage protein (TIGR02220 family)
MSLRALSYVKELTEDPSGKRLKTTEKFVLLILADYHNDHRNIAWPDLRRLALECLLSKRALITTLGKLQERGLLKIVRRDDGNGWSIRNAYTLPCLPPPRGEESAPLAQDVGGEVSDTQGVKFDAHRGEVSDTPKENSYLIQRTGLREQERVSGSEATADRALGVGVQAERILAVLNKEARRGFPFRTPHGKYTANAELILALLKAGWTEEQITRVVRLKCQQWGSVPKDRKFLRPSTLFRASNFAGYVGELADRAPKLPSLAEKLAKGVTTRAAVIAEEAAIWTPEAADLQALRDAAEGRGA